MKPQPLRRVKGKAVLALPEPASLREAAYDAIKHQIITCAYKPGEYLNEAAVSARLGIGRTPVHQAIDQLNLEGLLEVIPRKGVLVRPVSLDEILQIIEVRLINEIRGVGLAADRADPEEIRNLGSILQRAKGPTLSRDTEQLMLLDREFHLVLARASKNAVLADLLAKLHDRSLRFWFLSLNEPDHLAKVHAQHADIVDAIRRRDSKAASQAARAHIEDFRNNVKKVI